MQIPEVETDEYREIQPSEDRIARCYFRKSSDTTNPTIVEFYYDGEKLKSIEPLITNAVKLSEAEDFIKAAKEHPQYQYLAVFFDKSDSSETKYITAIPRGMDLDFAVKRLVENNANIIKMETTEDY